MANIILSPANFTAPKQLDLPECLSLNEIAEYAVKDVAVPSICKHHEVVIEVDGEYIPKSDWHLIPRDGQLVKLYMPVRGGGKSPLRILLSIAVVAASFFAGPELAAMYFAGSALAAGVISFGIMTAGTFLVNAIAPVRPQGKKSGDVKDAPAYSISGARNQLSPYQPVPVVLGRHRFFPPLAAKPYTELVDNDEYIRILLAWCGPCKIENIKIGDTPIEDYPGFTTDGGSSIEVREGWATDDPITLIPGVVNQTRVDVKLTNADGWVDRTMAAGYDELSVEVSFPQGLIRFDKQGKRKPVSVRYNIRYRQVGSPTWIYLDDTVSYSSTSRAISTMTDTHWSAYATIGGQIEFHPGASKRVGATRIGEFDGGASGIINITNFGVPNKTGLVISANSTNVSVSSGTLIHDNSAMTITGTTTSLIRRSFYGKVDRTKSYQVGLMRMTADSTDERISDDIYWTVFRGTKNDPPLNFPVPMAQIAIRIKASEGAQNQIDIINCITSSYAPRFISGSWETTPTTTSSNPAALFRGILIHPANRQPRAANQIDDATLGDWYELCESEGYEFNQVREVTTSVWDCLADVAFAGRGAPALPYGMWSVDFDQATRSIKGHVTPKNSWGFKASKQLINRPHAFKVIFNNEDKDWLEDEIIVYDDGYNVSNATEIERLEFKGVTNSDQAWKFGRYHIAQARLRPETYTVFMDFEHLTFRRNDLVMVSHDVPRWSDHWGRVKSVITDGGTNAIAVVVDEMITMEVGETYAARFRLNNGDSLVLSIDNVGIETSTLTFASPIPISQAPVVDNLFMFNIADTTAVELICLGMRRQQDLVAEISFVDHAPEIYDADTGTIPPFNSHINGRLFPMFLPTPVIESARGELYNADFVGGELKQRIIIIGSLPPDSSAVSNRQIIVRYRLKDSLEPWTEVTFTSEPIEFNVPSEGVYEVAGKQKGVLQGIPGYYGLAESLWTDIVEVSVVSIIDVGLPAPTNIMGFYEMDDNGLVTKVKLRMNVDISQTVPAGAALMVSVQAVPRELEVEDHNTYLKVTNANVLNNGSFVIKAGSTSSKVVVADNSKPLPDYDLSGFFWGTLNGAEYRKATGSTKTAFEFNQPFSSNPVTGQNLDWVELAWSDERRDEFKLFNLVSSSGVNEVAKWSAINFTAGEYRITVDRAEEGTSKITAVKAQYYPAPGAGTETILIPANNFSEVATNEFESSADVQILVPPGSWIAVTTATYVIQGLRVIRSPIVPITNWRRL